MMNQEGGSLMAPLLDLTRRGAWDKLLALMALGNPTFLSAQLDACVVAQLRESVFVASLQHRSAEFAALACRVAGEAGVAEDVICAIREDISRRCAAVTGFDQQWFFARELLIRFSTEIQRTRQAACSGTVMKCCEYIDRRFYCSISLEELGRLCGRSPRYVSDLFRKELGIGALQYAHQIKLQHGKFLVEHSDVGIARIAALLSYPSHSNFSQRFKKVYGVTPQEYRVTCGN